MYGHCTVRKISACFAFSCSLSEQCCFSSLQMLGCLFFPSPTLTLCSLMLPFKTTEWLSCSVCECVCYPSDSVQNQITDQTDKCSGSMSVCTFVWVRPVDIGALSEADLEGVLTSEHCVLNLMKGMFAQASIGWHSFEFTLTTCVTIWMHHGLVYLASPKKSFLIRQQN